MKDTRDCVAASCGTVILYLEDFRLQRSCSGMFYQHKINLLEKVVKNNS